MVKAFLIERGLSICVYQQQVIMAMRRFGQIKGCLKRKRPASVRVVGKRDATRGRPTAPLRLCEPDTPLKPR